MIIITGAAGFIGSNLLSKLNQENYRDIVLVDDFRDMQKVKNLAGKTYAEKVERRDFFPWLIQNHRFVQFIFHLGARTDTTEKDVSIFNELNLEYSKELWSACVDFGIPIIYASSAATYGAGEFGYKDDLETIYKLKPLNQYAISKHKFDLWALEQKRKPYFWAGLKFFNVYGPNEYHKGRMASVALQCYKQIQHCNEMKLFRSHWETVPDGQQKRDFIYVKDVVEIMYFMMQKRNGSSIYNIGSGTANTFYDLAKNTFNALGLEPNIKYIDTPEDIRETYQYFTIAEIDKLKSLGYDKPLYSFEQGIREYVKEYLAKERIN